MDNYHAQLVAESNKRLISALGMHWENAEAQINGRAIPYGEVAFLNVAHKPLDF